MLALAFVERRESAGWIYMDSLIAQLRAYRSTHVFNPWRDRDEMDLDPKAAEARVERLRCHFNCQPKVILLGEAPGYQGCRFSGIPFTNEKLILAGGIPRVTAAGRFSSRGTPWSEPSATVVWGTLHALGLAERTILWNAFAWHPHRADEPYSNRKPARAELEAGAETLRAILAHFDGVPVVAVGQVSADTLGRLGVKMANVVRHPAFGGATEFREQMRRMFARAAR